MLLFLAFHIYFRTCIAFVLFCLEGVIYSVVDSFKTNASISNTAELLFSSTSPHFVSSDLLFHFQLWHWCSPDCRLRTTGQGIKPWFSALASHWNHRGVEIPMPVFCSWDSDLMGPNWGQGIQIFNSSRGTLPAQWNLGTTDRSLIEARPQLWDLLKANVYVHYSNPFGWLAGFHL